MKKPTTLTAVVPAANIEEAWQEVGASFEPLRWTGAAMREAAKGFRRLKACKHLPALRAALAAHQIKHTMNSNIEDQALAA